MMLKKLHLSYTEVNDAGCAALAAALDSGALPALKTLFLYRIPASVAAKEAVHAALARSAEERVRAQAAAREALRSAINRNERGPLESALELAEACGLKWFDVTTAKVALDELWHQEAVRVLRAYCDTCLAGPRSAAKFKEAALHFDRAAALNHAPLAKAAKAIFAGAAKGCRSQAEAMRQSSLSE